MTNKQGSSRNGWDKTGVADGTAAAKTSSLTLTDGRSHFAMHGADRIHYVTVGNGNDTIVLVHGWSCHLGFWREQIAALADQARLILIDLPGHGQSDQAQTHYTLDFFAGAVLAVLHDAKVDKAVFIGHSMGAAVICRICKQAPEKVAALVSVDGLLRRPPGAPGQAEAMLAQMRSPAGHEFAKQFVQIFFPIPGTEALRDEVTAQMLQTPQIVMAGAMAAMLDANQPDWELSPLGVPLLVLNAKGSPWVADYDSFVPTLSPQVEYRQFENTGHFLMLEKPAMFNAALTELLEKYDLLAN